MNNYFINEAMDYYFNSYLNIAKTDNFLGASNFGENVINYLVKLYGKVNIVNPYLIKSVEEFENNLGMYGYKKNNIMNFYKEVMDFYTWEKEGKKGKCRSFNVIQKMLYDMTLKKCDLDKNVTVDSFKKLFYTTDNKNINYQMFNLLYSANPNEIALYINNKRNTTVLVRNRANVLSPKYYQSYGLTMEEVNKLDDDQFDALNKYLLDEATSEDVNGGRTDVMENVLTKVLKQPVRGTSGYVDALLLTGIFATIIMIGFVAFIFLFMR